MIKSYSILLCSFLYFASAAQNATDGERVARQTFYNPYLYRPGFYSQINPYPEEALAKLYPSEDLPLSWNGQVNSGDQSKEPSFRQNLFGLSNINNAINPFAAIFGKLPQTIIRNPNAPSLTNNFESCVDSNGLAGICVRPWTCAGFGGRLANSCGLGSVCCVNTLAKCGGQVTVNNTYWQSPATISSGSTCGVTITLDNNLLEQKKQICQVRLDFLSFSIAQPNAETVCTTDTFQVGGASNKVPVICGDNAGQHMYLEAPSSVTDLQLLFTFGASTVSRLWNIKISMLPCGAKYLAPSDCLQYFTQASGTVMSFNWKDISGTAARQLANQDYRICFRTELVSNQVSNRICYTTCSLSNGGNAWSLSGDAADTVPADVPSCNNDYLLIEAGFNPTIAQTDTANTWDRYCGTAFNTGGADPPSATICSTVKSFAVTYRTNGDEGVTDTVDVPDAPPDTPGVGNIGFCLSFQQSS